MLDRLDATLKNLLEHATFGLPDPLPNITFALPDNKFAPPVPAINLFLYDVRENRELRSNEPRLERTVEGKSLMTPPPARVDCSYLITAWAADAAPAVEHKLLGDVMQVFLRAPTIPEAVLDPALRHQHMALPLTALQPSRLQSIGEFWQAGGRPKTVLNLTVTIAVALEGEAIKAPIVTERIVRMRVGATQDSQ